jgi:predicted kinase
MQTPLPKSNDVIGRRVAVLVSGDPAAGKSTLGTHLAQRLGAAILDLDVVTGPLTEVIATMSGHRDLSDPTLAALTRGPRYATLFDLAEANLRAGRPVVLIAPFSAERRDPAAWDETRTRLEAAGAAVTLIWLHLPPAELLTRMRARSAGRDVTKLDDIAGYLAGLQSGPPVGPHLELDGRRPATELVAAVVRQLLF